MEVVSTPNLVSSETEKKKKKQPVIFNMIMSWEAK